jgi:Ulp1 family protease
LLESCFHVAALRYAEARALPSASGPRSGWGTNNYVAALRYAEARALPYDALDNIFRDITDPATKSKFINDYYKVMGHDWSNCVQVHRGTTTPQQPNYYDCGLYTAMAANCCSAGVALNFSLTSGYLRKRFMSDVLASRIMRAEGDA